MDGHKLAQISATWSISIADSIGPYVGAFVVSRLLCDRTPLNGRLRGGDLKRTNALCDFTIIGHKCLEAIDFQLEELFKYHETA